jgi:tetratricopeptide (TPR) repeat protein
MVPRSVSLLVDERASRLDAAVRELLATAAEVGDEFDFDLLVSASGAGGDAVLDALEQGLGAGLLDEAGGRYRFAHPLFRAMLRKAIPGRARPALHHRVARTMAAGVDPANRAAIDAAGVAGVNLLAVAEHAATAAELGEASAVPLAVGFGFAAGGRQADLFDFAGAVATLRRTVGLWYRLPAEHRSAFPASRALVALGWAQHGLNDRAAAAEAFENATIAATTDEDRAAAWIAAAWMPYQQGRFDAADELLARGLATVADPVARASLQADRAWIVGRLGRWRESRAMLEEVMPVLERGATPLLLARSLDRLGVTLRDTGEPAAALPVFDRAMTLARGINDTRMEAVVGEHLAGALRELGRLDEARSAATNAIEVARRSGDRYMESVSEWIASEVDHSAGDLASARRRRTRELEILATIGGNPQNEAMAHAYLAHVARLEGDQPLVDRESAAARAIALHSGIPRLIRRVEAALGAQDWFDAGAHTEAGTDATSD